MDSCKRCQELLTPEGFCPVCDFGWEPGERSQIRLPDAEISVPYDADGNVDVNELEEQIKKEE